MSKATSSSISSARLGDLLTEIERGDLIVRPAFQRKLVWTDSVKDAFIETVLLGLPFPEIFVAVGEHDERKMKRKKWLVDGQQRLTTLLQYINDSSQIKLEKAKPFGNLTSKEKDDFSDYTVAVRDLGLVTPGEVKEIFSRINFTGYTLNQMEKLNALFNGKFKNFCIALAESDFFKEHKVFSKADEKRMQDVNFCVILVITMLSTYFNRDEKNAEYLERYNDDFPHADDIRSRLAKVFSYIESAAISMKGRAKRKTDLLNLLVELDVVINRGKTTPAPTVVGKRVNAFYEQVEELRKKLKDDVTIEANSRITKYLQAATTASNDRYRRVERSEILSGVIAGKAK